MRPGAGSDDSLWRSALLLSGLIIAWFCVFELLDRGWLAESEVSARDALHLVRGLGAVLLAVVVTLQLTHGGAMSLPQRPDSARAVERAERGASWLVQLRWLAAVGVVAAVAFSHASRWLEPGAAWRLWLGAAALFAINGALAWRGRPAAVQSSLHAQLAADSLVLAWLLHYSGGIENPFFLLYIFHGQVAAILLPGRAAAALAVWSAALLLSIGLAEQTGALGHHPLLLVPHPAGARCFARSLASAGPMLAAFLVVHGGATFFTSRVMGRLRLDDARMLAAERLSAIGRIVGFVAHEVNNPIGVISTKAQLALSRPRLLEDPERMRASMETIARQAERVAGIVRTLLSATYPASARLGELPLAEAVDDVTERLAPRFRDSGVALERSAGTRAILRDVRFSELAQVLAALLLNALEASDRGGTVRISTEDGDGWAEVRVGDDGPGIAPEDLARVFEPFFSTKPHGGAGLSLAMCRAVAAGLGGRLAARSVLGRGSEFVLRLPAAGPRDGSRGAA